MSSIHFRVSVMAGLPALPAHNLTVCSAIQLKQQRDKHKCSGAKTEIKLHKLFHRSKMTVLWLA